jgi:tetratricopeptide (TPR) repeat protein
MAEAATRAGAYRLVEHIASGGMGVVYLAERDDGQVRHQAAVKILRRGLDAEDQIRRFTSERQILASLEHPNIARLIDAGITTDNRPYFVMEYVPGEPIDRYCDKRKLSVRDRVALMRDVARAVEHAHRNLIVHRDLKPNNILVTDDGQVKLLDFGIAKLLDAEHDDATSMTAPGIRLMTPGYASPEQMTGARITTATDVYVLGLLLYELLTGTRAQDTEGRSIPEIEKLIVEGVIPKPSDAITRIGEETTDRPPITAVADDRGTTPARLKRLLRGDLDRIVGMAVRKEPERRYPSAAAFADDLDRYLRGKPVLARGDAISYKVGKFLRRRWPAVVVAAMFLALLVTYAVTMTMQARQIAAERDRAQLAQAKAEEVTAFLMRMFQASDPSETGGDEVTARELLARGLARVEALQDQPDVQAELLEVIGSVYQSLGKFNEARPLVERAVEIRRREYGEMHAEVGESLSRLGDIMTAQGKYSEARETLEKALAINEAVAGRESAATATSLHLLAAVLVDLGDPARGRELFEQALAIRQRVLKPEDPDIAESLSGLAYAASAMGDFEEMERRHSEALQLLRKAFGDRHPRVALALNNLAVAVDNPGRYEEAERLHRQALAMRREIFGDEHPSVATSLNNLTNVLQRQEKYAEAEPLLRQVVALRRKLLGDDHPSTGTSLNNLAVLLFRMNRPQEAEPVMREARELSARRLPPHHPTLAAMDASLASMLAAQGRDAEAEALFKSSLERRIKTLGPEHPDIAAGQLGYGRFLSAQKRYEEAQPLLEGAYALRTKLLGAQHPDTVRAGRELLDLYRATQQSARAEELSRSLQQQQRPGHPESSTQPFGPVVGRWRRRSSPAVLWLMRSPRSTIRVT